MRGRCGAGGGGVSDDELSPWDKAMRDHEAALRTAFKVRVRLSECRGMLRWHGEIEDGAVGKILPVDYTDPQAPPDHPYWVWFDRPLRARQSWWYTAAELIPITLEEMLDDATSNRRPGA